MVAFSWCLCSAGAGKAERSSRMVLHSVRSRLIYSILEALGPFRSLRLPLSSCCCVVRSSRSIADTLEVNSVKPRRAYVRSCFTALSPRISSSCSIRHFSVTESTLSLPDGSLKGVKISSGGVVDCWSLALVPASRGSTTSGM